MRWRGIIVVGGFVLTAVVSSGATMFFKDFSDEFKAPSTPLLSHLSGTWEEANDAFRQRLLARVPLGSPESRLLETLRAEGFSRGWESTGSAERSATLEWSNIACNIGAPVTWRVDQADRIVSITTDYHERGCL